MYLVNKIARHRNSDEAFSLSNKYQSIKEHPAHYEGVTAKSVGTNNSVYVCSCSSLD